MRASIFLPLALVACQKPEKGLPDLLVPVDAAALGVAGGDGLGVGHAAFPVLGVNGLAAPVDAGTVSLASNGTLDTDTVVLDATGWGGATLSGEPGRYPVTLQSSLGSATTTVTLTEKPVPTAGFPAVDGLGSTSGLVVAGGGLVGVEDAVLRWAPPDGSPPVAVGTTVGSTLGLLPATFDDDGVGDLVAWSADAVLALRGRSAGGLTWASGWKAGGAEITAVVPARLDADRDGDLAVLVHEDGQARVLWLLGDGAGGFTLADALELDYGAWSISAEDLDGDGDAEVTVLTEDGLVNRYTRYEGAWTLSGNLNYDLDLAPGHRLHPGGDLDNDGVADILLYGPVGDGSTANVWVVSAGGSGVIYQLFAASADRALPSSVRVATGDLDGDGLAEVVMSTDTGVSRAAWATASSTFTVYDYGVLPTDRPVAAADVDGDGLGDVALGGSAALVLPGESVEDDPKTELDETVPWKIRTPDTLVSDLDLVVPPVALDRDGDGAMDLVALTTNSEGLSLTVYHGRTTGSVGFDRDGAVLLSAGGTALDLAVCDGVAYSLWESGGVTRLSRHTLGTGGVPVAGTEFEVPGDLVACGDFGGGADAAVANSAGGALILVAPDGDQQDGGAWEAVEDLAAADSDGDGVHTAFGCSTAGCTVAAGDLDGDGLEEQVIGDGLNVSVRWGAGGESVVKAAGVVAVQDADDDGRLDLVATDGGLVRAWRAWDGGLSPGIASFVHRPAEGPAYFADLGADGVLDLLLLGRDDDPFADPDWDGTVIYAQGAVP